MLKHFKVVVAAEKDFRSISSIVAIAAVKWKPFSVDCSSDRLYGKFSRILCVVVFISSVLVYMPYRVFSLLHYYSVPIVATDMENFQLRRLAKNIRQFRSSGLPGMFLVNYLKLKEVSSVMVKRLI